MQDKGINKLYYLTPMQESILYSYILNNEKNTYHIQNRYKITGIIDIEIFRRSVQILVNKYDILRTSFIYEKVKRPVQIVLYERNSNFHFIDVSDKTDKENRIESYVKEDRNLVFNLQTESLLRIMLIKESNSTYELVLSIHHIIIDGWSMELLLEDLIKVYSQLNNGIVNIHNDVIQFGEYVNWLENEDKLSARNYWSNYLKGYNEQIQLINSKVDDNVKDNNYGKYQYVLQSNDLDSIKQFGIEYSLTINTIFETAWAIFLSKINRIDDVMFGKVVSGRSLDMPNIQKIVGVFINTIPVRVRGNKDQTFIDIARNVQQDDLLSFKYCYLSLLELQKMTEIKRDIFQHLFVFENYPTIDNTDIEDSITFKSNGECNDTDYPFIIQIMSGEDYRIEITFDKSIYEDINITTIVDCYVNILREVINNPNITLRNISLVSENEKTKLLSQVENLDVEYPSNKLIHEIFESQVNNHKTKIAVSYLDETITYDELNKRANKVAHVLRSMKVDQEDIVAIVIDRSIDMIVNMLAILKAGAAYIPINTEYPLERMEYILKDSSAKVLIASSDILKQIQFTGDKLDLNDERISATQDGNLLLNHNSNNLAYIIYTSGTTGAPKGVMIEHKNVIRLLFNNKIEYDFRDTDVWSMFHSYCFDFSVWEMYGALLYGGRLVIVPKYATIKLDSFLDILRLQKVTVLNMVPSPFYILSEKEQESKVHDLKLRYIIFGGETLKYSKLKKWRELYPNIQLVNMYGITETTVLSSYKFIEDTDIEKGINNIGKVMPTTSIYVMDEDINLMPIGAIGELCVGGEGLGKGYVNNKTLTHEKFLYLKENPNKLIYRSGDLGRLMPNGDLEYLGRIDHQVKIHGFRIELSEIEKQLMEYIDIKDAIVIDTIDKQDNKILCAFYVCDEIIPIDILREHLMKALPSYMLPTHFVRLTEIPMGNNKKADRKKLLALVPQKDIEGDFCAPRNDREQIISDYWRSILGVESVGIDDDFFMLGGHSLKIMQVLCVIQKEFQVEVPILEFFKRPTIRQLSEYIDQQTKCDLINIEPIKKSDSYVISNAQKRIYLADRLNHNSTLYNIPMIMWIEGNVDYERFEEAFQYLVDRHDVFRTSFHIDNESIVQRVINKLSFKVIYEDITSQSKNSLQDKIQEFIRPFDLTKAPLARVSLVKVDNMRYLFMFDIHHIIADGKSIQILIDELMQVYNGKDLKPIRLQYKDYAAWENTHVRSARILKQEEYWSQMFKNGVPQLDMPTDYTRSNVQELNGAEYKYIFNEETTNKVRRFCTDQSITLYMFFLSGIYILLSKYSQQKNILIGTPVEGRVHISLDNMVGMFVNILVLRNKPDNNKTYLEFLLEVKNNFINALQNQEYPYDELIDKLHNKYGFNRNALFDVMFSVENSEESNTSCDEFSIVPYDHNITTSKYDITFTIINKKDQIILKSEYRTSLYKEDSMKKLIEHFVQLITELIQDPKKKISEFNVLSEKEKELVCYQYNATYSPYDDKKTIQQLFIEQAEKTPKSIAVTYNDQSITYEELNLRTNQLASILTTYHVVENNVVAIMIERSIDMIVGIIGILKAGYAYLPIDKELPKQRINYMLEDSNVEVLLTRELYADDIEFDKDIVYLEKDKIITNAPGDLICKGSSDNLAYILYTSGSTGKPKGVMIRQKNTVNFIHGLIEKINMNEVKSILAITTISFDIFFVETILPLTQGLRVVIADDNMCKSFNKLGRFIYDNKIDIIQMTPSLMKLLWENDNKLSKLKNVKKILIGGEVFSKKLLNELQKLKSTRVFNMYGPTETTIWSTIKELTNCDTITIGKPIANTQIYIINEVNGLQGINMPGELCISGDGIAAGYINKKELTNQRFIQNPYQKGSKLYKTGDLAKWLDNGEIEYLGRMDYQVKIRGHRIELGEIENCILSYKNIAESIVVEHQEKNNNTSLVAYFVSNDQIETDEIRQYLLMKLPEYMIPSYFIRLEEMPLTPSGKIDRKQLPFDQSHIKSKEDYVAPRNDLDLKIITVWKKILEKDMINIDDDFFEIGGHSLKAIMLEVEFEKIGLKIDYSDIYRYRSIRRVSDLLVRYKEGNDSLEKEMQEDKDNIIDDTLTLSRDNVIKPFNDFYYRSCLYNSLFCIIQSFNKSIITLLLNDRSLYKISKVQKFEILDVEYVSTEPINNVLNTMDIHYKLGNNNLITDITHAIDARGYCIVWIDCYYEKDRKDTFQQKHLKHSIVVYSYDQTNKVFYIIEHDKMDELSYKKKMISFEELEIAYNAYRQNFDNDSIPSYVELYLDEANAMIDGLTKTEYKNLYIQNYMINQLNVKQQLDDLKSFSIELNKMLTTEGKVKEHIVQILQGFNNIVNAKRAEKYIIDNLWDNDSEERILINDIYESWVKIRGILAKCIYIGGFTKVKSGKIINEFSEVCLKEELLYKYIFYSR